MTTAIQNQIWEHHPNLPRLFKVKLAAHIQDCYDRVVRACLVLGRKQPPAYSIQYSSLEDDYVVLMDDKNKSIADVYIGEDRTIYGQVLFLDGTEITEHSLLVLEGCVVCDEGYIPGCKCQSCQDAELSAVSQTVNSSSWGDSSRAFITGRSRRILFKGSEESIQSRLSEAVIKHDDCNIIRIEHGNSHLDQ